MNFSSVMGVVAALLVFGLGVLTSTKNTQVFLDPHGILVVLGGTAAAGLICFPLTLLLSLIRVFLKKVVGKYKLTFNVVITECTDLARGYRDDPGYLAKAAPTIKTLFLRDCIELIVQGGISDEVLKSVMDKRAETHAIRYDEEAEVFKTLSKFPPAFGLMATTLGMISLLQNIGAPDSFKQIGPSMAIGLVGTLYGLVLANFVFIPIGENLTKLNRDDETTRAMIIDGVWMIKRKEHPLIVQEMLMAYLLPKERQKFKKDTSSSSAAPSQKAA